MFLKCGYLFTESYNIVGKLNKLSLINRILIGMGIGILLGIFVPSLTVVGILGTVFVNALKAIAPLLVFLS